MTVYIVDIEGLTTRYTQQWKEHLPTQLLNYGIDVVTISGGDVPQATTPGAFLNFAGTNNYKSQQMLEISRMFAAGEVKDGDYFLYTDAWNPTVIQLKYMAELLGVKIRIGGMWHAGSYDPQDFLGRLIGNEPWVRHAEKSMYYCYDDNFFATRFHLDMFESEMFDWHYRPNIALSSNHIVGWPMEYLEGTLRPFTQTLKKQKIIFPHRIAPEKQVEIFRDLANELPQYEWFVAQDHKLTKAEYHQHLSESKLMFSASLQETLGITAYEAALVGAYPVLPDRLSYSEMWASHALYPSHWTEDWNSYIEHKGELKNFIVTLMKDTSLPALSQIMAEETGVEFFNGEALYKHIVGYQC